MDKILCISKSGSVFQDVNFFIEELSLELFSEEDIADTDLGGYTKVWQNMTIHHPFKGADLIGGVQISFRNQGTDFNSCLILKCELRAYSDSDSSPRSVFCKLIQHLFELTEQLVDEKKIKDRKGEVFVVPKFLYSINDFKTIADQ